MPTYFFYEQFQDIEPEWKEFFRSIIITETDSDGVFYFTQEGNDIKVQIQTGQEYPLKGMKQICYHKAKHKQGIPLFKYELRR